MEVFDRGSAIQILVESRMRAPYEPLEDYTPITRKITITDPLGTVVVNAQDILTTETEGKLYYNLQTLPTWEAGIYEVIVDVTFSGGSDRTVLDPFKLK